MKFPIIVSCVLVCVVLWTGYAEAGHSKIFKGTEFVRLPCGCTKIVSKTEKLTPIPESSAPANEGVKEVICDTVVTKHRIWRRPILRLLRIPHCVQHRCMHHHKVVIEH